MKNLLKELNIGYLVYEKRGLGTGEEDIRILGIVLHDDYPGEKDFARIRREKKNYEVLSHDEVDKITEEEQYNLLYNLYRYINSELKEAYVERLFCSCYGVFSLVCLFHYLEESNLEVHFKLHELQVQLRNRGTKEIVKQGSREEIMRYLEAKIRDIIPTNRNLKLADYISYEADVMLLPEMHVVDMDSGIRVL